MPRPRKPARELHPRNHKGSAVLDVWDDGRRRTITLGKWNTPEADEEFGRVKMMLLAGRRPTAPRPLAAAEPLDLTIAEALLKYTDHIERYYRNADGTPTGTAEDIKIALGYVRRACSATPLAEFGISHFRIIRDAMIGDGRVRQQVNKRAAMVRSFIRWCVAEDLPVAPGVLEKLRAVRPLSPGRDGAKEGTRREPADSADVAKVIPLLPPAIRAIVQLIRLTGARPTEIAAMRSRELDRTKAPWELRPEKHKGSWRGKVRTIYIGPEGRAVLEPWLVGIGPDDFVFTPRRSEEIRNGERSAGRITPRYPSHMRRNAAKRKGRVLKDRIRWPAITSALYRACRKAGVANFTAYQLRHLRAAELREQYGLEHVRAVLGHSFAAMSAHYAAAADKSLASRVASEIG